MSSTRADGPHGAFVDPLLEGRVTDPKPVRRGANGEQRHLTVFASLFARPIRAETRQESE
jgi:hypothetical protein